MRLWEIVLCEIRSRYGPPRPGQPSLRQSDAGNHFIISELDAGGVIQEICYSMQTEEPGRVINNEDNLIYF